MSEVDNKGRSQYIESSLSGGPVGLITQQSEVLLSSPPATNAYLNDECESTKDRRKLPKNISAFLYLEKIK